MNRRLGPGTAGGEGHGVDVLLRAVQQSPRASDRGSISLRYTLTGGSGPERLADYIERVEVNPFEAICDALSVRHWDYSW